MRPLEWSKSGAPAVSRWITTVLLVLLICASPGQGMTDDQIAILRQDTRNLFYHGYSNYMTHAFPEDELRPLSCKPQTRNRENPADIGLNDVLGNYSLTLIDSLSTLAILASGQRKSDEFDSLQDFKDSVKAVVDLYGGGSEEQPCGSRACGFDLDSKVQVFETNIRGVGGLLSAHLFAIGELPIRNYTPKWTKQKNGSRGIEWDDFIYRDQLLRLAQDLATRLLPAFSTETELPYPRVNLRHGIPFYRDDVDGVCRLDGTSTNPKEVTETCAAGAGSLVLEFSTLSRLTGDPQFENVAKAAFWAVWDRRSAIGLIGNGIDAENGDWTNPPLAGIGAGIDSFFEYALKSSILLSGIPFNQTEAALHDPAAFLNTWQKAHASVRHHILRPASAEKYPFYGQTDFFSGAPRYSWIDNLSAYYPGLLTLAGEVDEAIQSHLLFVALWTRYAALPERWHVHNAAIDPDFRHWAGRPEFIESTFYLYQATKDPFYLHVGEMVLRDIRRRCWTPCGWADLKDVQSGEKRDRMESFFLGETAKYLYLLFERDHPLNKLDAPIVFTTEGHPLIIPDKYRSKSRLAQHLADDVSAPAPVCPAPPPSLPLTESNLMNRSDLFHAAALVQLQNVPIQPSRASALVEASQDSPGISLADIHSPTNYTFFPWTLPQHLVPPSGFSSPIRSPVVSTLTFSNFNPVTNGGSHNVIQLQSVRKYIDGVVVSSLSNLRLSMIQEPKPLLMPNLEGVLTEVDVGPQYRVHGVSNWALGRDEKVMLTKEALDGVAPGDPNFKRVKDLEIIDIILDYQESESASTKWSDQASQPSDSDSNSNVLQRNSTVGVLLQDLETLFAQLVPDIEGTAPSPTFSLIPSPSLVRTIFPAILPTGLGAAPLPPSIDAMDSIKLDDVGKLALSSIYYLDDPLCTPAHLPASIARDYQILLVKRGGCSFSEKLANIPSLAPAKDSLQLVIVLSPTDPRSFEEGHHTADGTGNPADDKQRPLGDKLIRPLLDERQRTPAGFERRHGIAMAMIEGTDEVDAALRSAATVIGRFDRSGELMEVKKSPDGAGLAIKRRYWFESMGIPIGNLIAL